MKRPPSTSSLVILVGTTTLIVGGIIGLLVPRVRCHRCGRGRYRPHRPPLQAGALLCLGGLPWDTRTPCPWGVRKQTVPTAAAAFAADLTADAWARNGLGESARLVYQALVDGHEAVANDLPAATGLAGRTSVRA